MSEHKFKIGQWVSYGPPRPKKNCLHHPAETSLGGRRRAQYRIKAADEPHERVVTEAELRDASHLENKP